MAQFVSRFGWAIMLVIVGAFVWFSIEISKPVESSLQEDLIVGVIRHAPELDPEGPLLGYVALFAGRPAGRPEYPVDDELPAQDGSFALDADPIDGTRYFLLARIETAQERLFCETLALPEMRVDDDGQWVVASTGEPLPPKHVVVDKSTPCSY